MSNFIEISPAAWEGNPFTAIGKEWMLITAGDRHSCNTMTASWGGMGVLWNKDVTFGFIRHSRHTFSFVEEGEYYSLCFFPEEYRPALTLCGRVSGRDADKIAQAGLTPVFDREAPYFAEASTVFICRKVYAGEIAPEDFVAEDIHTHYPTPDYHRMYVGEILHLLKKESSL